MRNPESQEILLMESGILSFGIRNTDQGIWNPNNDRNPEFYSFTEKYWNPVPGIRNPQRGIQNPRLCCAGWRMSIYNYIHTEIYSLKSYDVNFLITWIFEPQALSSTNYHLNVYFKGQCHCWEGHFVYRYQFSLGPGSAVGKKEKKIGEQSEPRGSLRRGKCGAALSPSPGHRSARFLRRYFSYLTPFFAFLPHCGAWSRANDSYTMTLEKLPLKDKIIALCLQDIIVNYKQQKWTLKNC